MSLNFCNYSANYNERCVWTFQLVTRLNILNLAPSESGAEPTDEHKRGIKSASARIDSRAVCAVHAHGVPG